MTSQFLNTLLLWFSTLKAWRPTEAYCQHFCIFWTKKSRIRMATNLSVFPASRQFHQHFTYKFFVQTSSFLPTCIKQEKSCSICFRTKNAREKTLMKLTPGCQVGWFSFTIILTRMVLDRFHHSSRVVLLGNLEIGQNLFTFLEVFNLSL